MASTLDISLPDPIKTYAEAGTQAGAYGSPNQYISDLILDDRDRRLALKEHLLESLNHAEDSLEISDEDWQHGDIVGLIEEHANKLK